MVVIILSLYLPPNEEKLCIQIKTNAQIFELKYFGLYFPDVNLWQNITKFKVGTMVNLLTIKPPRALSFYCKVVVNPVICISAFY